MGTPFKPSYIYVDEEVAHLSLTQKILEKLKATPHQIITDSKKLKHNQEITWAKKGLLLARHKSEEAIKLFKALARNNKQIYYALNLISNCHFECTYCILQSYLANNPLITIYTNLEEVLEKLKRQLEVIPDEAVIGTGKIADSLALEEITEFHTTLIPFFAKQNKNVLLELKTKSDRVESLLSLNHCGKTIVSWSMNPPYIVEREEYKTATVSQRLNAAKKCVDAGYKVAFHLDPMIFHEGWEKNYGDLITQIFDMVAPEKIAWMSLGVLRFPNRQKKIIEKRFPKNKNLLKHLRHSHLPFLTYETGLREKMYQMLYQKIAPQTQTFKLYTCMEMNN